MKNQLNKKYSHFVWEGIQENGFKIKGKLYAESLLELKKELSKKNIILMSFKKKYHWLYFFKLKKISYQQINEFAHEVSLLLSSGISLSSALSIIADNTAEIKLSKLVLSIKNQVESGCLLADALKSSLYFDDIFINLVFASEQSGTLNTILNQLFIYREKIILIRRKIKKALYYPCFVLSISLLVIAALLTFVIPKFSSLFNNIGSELPFFTQMIINVSILIKNHLGKLILLGIIAVIMVKILFKRSEKFRILVERLLLHMPFTGNLIREPIFSRCFYTLSLMVGSGLPLLQSLEYVANVAGNSNYKQGLLQIKKLIMSGRTLSAACKEVSLFPDRVVQVIVIAEESGCLEKMLYELAQYYEKRFDHFIDTISQFLEPAIMLFLSIIVGGLVIALYLPVFRLGYVM
jgi:type IV pilus assembly protein PilC